MEMEKFDLKEENADIGTNLMPISLKKCESVSNELYLREMLLNLGKNDIW